jgi:arylformamidase
MIACYLSYFLEENTPIYGGEDGAIQFQQKKSIKNGDSSNNQEFHFPGHSGTHIDFPLHFSDEGKSCNDYAADFWIFKKVGLLCCTIEEMPNKLQELPKDLELLILKTGFGDKRGNIVYWQEQPVIPASFAKLLRSSFPFLRVFGFDLISLTSKLNREEGKKAHFQFLIENDILILEDMNLSGLQEAPSNVIIAPMLIQSADGVPCNVIGF